jgi:hypothetical protein
MQPFILLLGFLLSMDLEALYLAGEEAETQGVCGRDQSQEFALRNVSMNHTLQ